MAPGILLVVARKGLVSPDPGVVNSGRRNGTEQELQGIQGRENYQIHRLMHACILFLSQNLCERVSDFIRLLLRLLLCQPPLLASPASALLYCPGLSALSCCSAFMAPVLSWASPPLLLLCVSGSCIVLGYPPLSCCSAFIAKSKTIPRGNRHTTNRVCAETSQNNKKIGKKPRLLGTKRIV